MKKATLKALKQSIAHWWRLANDKARPGEIPNSDHCALCRRFMCDMVDDCEKSGELCPVKERTEKTYCYNTPYYKAAHEWKKNEVLRNAGLPQEFENQQAEFEFLVSLLPAGESWTSPDGWEWCAK